MASVRDKSGKRNWGRAFDRPHWSYSQLSQFLRCPLQFYFERIAKLPRPFTSSAMAFGSAVHEGLATYHRKLQRGEENPKDEVQQAFVQTWDAAEAERPVQFRDRETRADVLEQGVALLEAYLAEPPPTQILAVEEPLIVPLHTSQGEFLEKPLVAVLDLLHRQDENGLMVREFKTSGRRFNEFEADNTVQASCYAHAVEERYGEPATVKYVVLVKTKKPAIQHLETSRSPADIGRLGDLVATVEKAITAEAFYPIESPMNCSGCPFRVPCREWTGTSHPGQSCEQHSRETVPC